MYICLRYKSDFYIYLIFISIQYISVALKTIDISKKILH